MKNLIKSCYKNFNFVNKIKIGTNILKPSLNKVYFSYFSTHLKSHNNLEKIVFKFENGIIRRDDYIFYLNHVSENYLIDSDQLSNNKLFLKYLELSINKSILQLNFDEIFPLVVKAASSLKINSDKFWNIINTEFSRSFHRLGINIVFKLLNDLNEFYPNNENVKSLKDRYYKNLTRNKVLVFNLETFINYLNTFNGFHGDQSLINDIQKLIIELSKSLNKEEQMEFIRKIISTIENQNKEINFKIILSHLLLRQ